MLVLCIVLVALFFLSLTAGAVWAGKGMVELEEMAERDNRARRER